MAQYTLAVVHHQGQLQHLRVPWLGQHQGIAPLGPLHWEGAGSGHHEQEPQAERLVEPEKVEFP